MGFDIAEWILKIPVLLFAITIHEYAHGRAAFSLGDPTAKLAGRLTWNPISHIDPLGAISLFIFNFGWAKPVPVNTNYFQNRRKDIILMALSGPVANLAAAFIAGLFIRYLLLPWEFYVRLLIDMLLMNLGLGLFNLLPVPPLDGSHVLENLLPSEAAQKYRRLGRYGAPMLIGVMILDSYARLGILNKILLTPMIALAQLFAGDNLFRIIRWLQ